MNKTLYRKFVAQASDCTESTPHLRADCYALGQALKLGLSMCMAAAGKVEVRRKDALGQPVTVTIREAFVDDQGHEYTRNGIMKNPNAHNFTLISKGYLPVGEDDEPRPDQIFEPVKAEKSSKWTLKATDAKAITAKADASADELEARAKAIRANAAVQQVKDKVAKAAADKAEKERIAAEQKAIDDAEKQRIADEEAEKAAKSKRS